MMSSMPIIGFELTYQGKFDTIQIGIGLDEKIFQLLRKILRQIFPILDQEYYSGSVSNVDRNSKMNNSSSTSSGDTITTRYVIYHDDYLKSIELIKKLLVGNDTTNQQSTTQESNIFTQDGDLLSSTI